MPRLRRLWLPFLVFGVVSSACTAADAGPSPVPDPAESSRIASAVDGIFDKAVADGDVPGAVIAVVKDGGIAYLHGYGFAELATKKPVDPERTLFYLASLTKVFTATAVMQQVERGTLDLHADVNRTLKSFRVDDRYPEPVTLAHLLTHTAGFDDRSIGYAAHTAAETEALGLYLSHALPPRVRPPGIVTSYSNHGYGLAGYLVEIASGRPYAEYLDQNILAPLGMSHTTARNPPPPGLAGDLATGYEYDFRTGNLEPVPGDFRNVPPAGSVRATAPDMARFLIAHLQDGQVGEARILKEETARTMHARQFTHQPRLPGMTFGFFEGSRHGVRLLLHPGGAPGASALAVLAPDRQLGIFVAANTSAPVTMRRASEAVLDAFLPRDAPAPAPAPPAGFAARAGRFTGCYQSTRYSRRSIEKFAIWDTQVCVRPGAAGTLRLEDRRGQGSEWVEIEPDLFQSTTSDQLLAFREEGGRVAFMFGDQGGFPTAYERLPWWESVTFQLPYLLTLMAVLISSFTLWPLSLLARRLVRRLRPRRGARPGSREARSPAPRLVIPLAMLAGTLAFALMAGLDAWLGNSAYRLTLVYGMSREMVALLWGNLAFAVLALVLAGLAVQCWRRRWWGIGGRAWYSLVATAALLFVVFLAQWNLLGFRY